MTRRSVQAFLERLSSKEEIEHPLSAILDCAVEVCNAERAFLMVRDHSGEVAVQTARNRNKENLTGARLSTTIVREALQLKKLLYLPQFPERLAKSESIQTLGIASAFCIPLLSPRSEELLGLLYLDSSVPSKKPVVEGLQQLEQLAKHLARLFEHSIQPLAAAGCVREEPAGAADQLRLLNADLEEWIDLQNHSPGKDHPAVGHLIGKSPEIKSLFKTLTKVVPTSVPVLITGETGTGKELIARYIHFNGPRRDNALFSINCSAFNETLLESELFGYRKGAFTGASENRPGLLVAADGGTLFLDEVGDMHLEMQKRLLRFLENGEVRGIGSVETSTVDVRIIAATNRDLPRLIQEGKFRDDFFFRLNVIPILSPPLRERAQDIPLLIEHYTEKICHELRLPFAPLPEPVRLQLLQYSWPGNVRELLNEIRRAVILGPDYRFERLPAKPNANVPSDPPNQPDAPPRGAILNLAAIECQTVIQALKIAGGNKQKAARLLGISRRSLYNKLQKFKLD